MRSVVHDEHLERDHWWFRARRRIFARLLAHHGLPRSAGTPWILDLGPGSGVNLDVLAKRGRLVSLDLSARSLETCAELARELGVRSDLTRADATRLPFRTGSLPLVCALDVLEHLPDDRAALAEIQRVLGPEGRLLLSVPAHPWMWGRQDVLAEHVRRYRRAELVERLEAAGFEILKLSYFNTLLFAPIAALRLLMRPFLAQSAARGSDLSVRLPFGLDAALYWSFAIEAGWLTRQSLPFGVSLLGLARPRPAAGGRPRA
jgi:SAM-dependent methyltransferase